MASKLRRYREPIIWFFGTVIFGVGAAIYQGFSVLGLAAAFPFLVVLSLLFAWKAHRQFSQREEPDAVPTTIQPQRLKLRYFMLIAAAIPAVVLLFFVLFAGLDRRALLLVPLLSGGMYAYGYLMWRVATEALREQGWRW